MKTLIVIAASLLMLHSLSFAKKKAKDVINELPKNLQIDNSEPQNYLLQTDYYDYDLKSNFRGKRRVSGHYTRGIQNDSAMWSNVFIAESKQEQDPFPIGIEQKYMDGFTYSITDDILSEEFLNKIPVANILTKNLVWDAAGFEVFAYVSWDSLKLNKPYKANEINFEVNMPNVGTFENKEIWIEWIGTTVMNNEPCAIIKFTAMNNPLTLNLEFMTMTGRSHYWGEVYVSLKDKQIEYATLKEDVLSDVKFKGQDQNVMGYTVRNINLTRIDE